MFQNFQTTYGKQTSEEFHPSLQLNQANAEPAPKSVLVSGTMLYVVIVENGIVSIVIRYWVKMRYRISSNLWMYMIILVVHLSFLMIIIWQKYYLFV